MKVNRTNYEVWMIDYFDGKLNAVEIDEFMAFIEENPDIKKEFEAFENVGVDTDEFIYTAKKQLKKGPFVATENINEENYDEFFIAYYEDDLNENHQQELIAFVELNPALKNEFGFHGKLILTDPAGVIYEEKAPLKRKTTVGIYWQISGVAAAILIMFGIFSLFDFGNSSSFNQSENKYTLNDLESKSITIDLKTQAVAGIISKQLQLADISFIQEETWQTELIAVNEISAKSPDFTIAKLSENISLAEHETHYFDITQAVAIVDKPKRKKAFGRIIQNLARKASGKSPENDNIEETSDPGFVKALGTGITVFNTITGSDTELVKSYNNQGKLTGYYVEGESIAWKRELAPNGE